MQRCAVEQALELLGGREVDVDGLDVGAGEFLEACGAGALAGEVEQSEVAQSDAVAVEHQLLGAADELHEDGDDVAAVIGTAVCHHVVSDLVDGQGSAALEEGIRLLGVALMGGVHE